MDDAAASSEGSKPFERKINVYAVYGNGRATEGGDMHWRAYEVGFGDVLNDYFSVYLSYLNEGHPVDHHRDGFAALGSFRWPVGNRLALEFSAGPYFSMDTTHVDNAVRNEKRWGVRASAAQLWYVAPIKIKWTLSAGVGPYVSRDRNEASSTMRLNALLSAQVTCQVTNDWAASLRFNRVATGNDKGQDMFMVGLARNF
ncbi:hypothetical protein BGV53_06270 [Burkholderia ubonensis]|uniref:hypothetical protein n=1 Tax=Burkholderia ubonensis TaxID=101571 RepID=UPI000923E3CA|nr:hypothetical protein [Burkholderia ubonensis]OJB19639.1 hypothetical protein BGV53_06270 [Burkholderia ubonensis]